MNKNIENSVLHENSNKLKVNSSELIDCNYAILYCHQNEICVKIHGKKNLKNRSEDLKYTNITVKLNKTFIYHIDSNLLIR